MSAQCSSRIASFTTDEIGSATDVAEVGELGDHPQRLLSPLPPIMIGIRRCGRGTTRASATL